MKKVQLSEWQVRDRHGYTICGNEMSDSLKRCAVILLGRSRPAGFQKRERSYHAGYFTCDRHAERFHRRCARNGGSGLDRTESKGEDPELLRSRTLYQRYS